MLTCADPGGEMAASGHWVPMNILPWLAYGPIAGEGAVGDWDIQIRSGPALGKRKRKQTAPTTPATAAQVQRLSVGTASSSPVRSSIPTKEQGLQGRGALRGLRPLGDSNRSSSGAKKGKSSANSEFQEDRLQVAKEMQEQLARSNALQEQKLQVSNLEKLLQYTDKYAEPEE